MISMMLNMMIIQRLNIKEKEKNINQIKGRKDKKDKNIK